MEDIVSLCKRTRNLLMILSAICILSRPTTAQPKPQTATPQLQSYADAGSVALMQQVMAAYLEVKGSKFLIKSEDTLQNQFTKRKIYSESNQAHVAFNAPDQVLVKPVKKYSGQIMTEYLFNEKNLFVITRSEDIEFLSEDKSKYKNTTRVRYYRDEIKHEQSLLGYWDLRIEIRMLSDALSLLQGKNEILRPQLDGRNFLQQNLTRLPSQIIDGEKMDGIQVRRRYGAGFNAKPYFRPSLTLTFWFGATDHLLRRGQSFKLPRLQKDLFEMGSNRRLPPRWEPGYVATDSITQLEINPKFAPNEFQFVPPPGAIRTDEDGRPLR